MTTEPTARDRLSSDPALRRYSDVRELIANPANPTPLVELKHIVPPGEFQLYLKLEWYNPFGSIKDRTAYYLLKGMAERGELDGKKLVEPTSGNTGIALAALAALMGKHLTVTIPDGVPEEKELLLRMLGAEVWATPDDLCPVNHPKDGAIALAQSFVQGTATGARYAMPNQYENADNVKAHYETTGPEIWKQTEGLVREPQKGHRLPGLKNLQESKPPGILDRSVIDEEIRVNDEPAYAMTKRLFREEGLTRMPPKKSLLLDVIKHLSSFGVQVLIDEGSVQLRSTTCFTAFK